MKEDDDTRRPEPAPAPAAQEAAAPAAETPAPVKEEKTPEEPKAKPEPAVADNGTGHVGPRILGKIDLNKKPSKPQPAPSPAKPTPAKETAKEVKAKDNAAEKHKHTSGGDRNGHRKRERIKGQGEKVDITKVDSGSQKNRNKKGGDNKDRKNRKEKPKPVRVEIDEDLIQKQIKETYARMTEGKGKTKSSKHKREKREMISQKMEEAREQQQLESRILKMTEFVTVNDLAVMMNIPVTKVIEACMNLGLMVSINQRLDADALVLVAEEFGYEVQFVSADEESEIQEEVDDPADLVERPPIITVMGHVDHGKTSLLDYIRKSNVIAGEAGGITQHIGAYNVQLPDGRRITFLDTPGHEAFTAMRARGAKITDLVIIIVAADDAIMPQTIEAINHAQAAGVPMVFAINKIDKPGANPDRIREQLANMNILVEDWGGKYRSRPTLTAWPKVRSSSPPSTKDAAIWPLSWYRTAPST